MLFKASNIMYILHIRVFNSHVGPTSGVLIYASMSHSIRLFNPLILIKFLFNPFNKYELNWIVQCFIAVRTSYASQGSNWRVTIALKISCEFYHQVVGRLIVISFLVKKNCIFCLIWNLAQGITSMWFPISLEFSFSASF